MKRKITLILILSLVAAWFAGCANAPASIALKDGKNLSDVYSAVEKAYVDKHGEDSMLIPMPMAFDATIFKDFYQLTEDDYTEYAGAMAMSMTNSDTLLMMHAAPGKVETVKAALEKRLEELRQTFEMYNVMNSYDRAKAGEVYVKGDYVFLIVAGGMVDLDETPDFASDLKLIKDTIDSQFK